MFRHQGTTVVRCNVRRRALPRGGFWRRLRAALAAVALGALITSPAAGQQAPAEHAEAKAVIETLNTALLETMKSGEALGYDGRYEKLAPVLRQVYDLPAMAKAALGGESGHWGTLSEEQKETFVDAFSRMSIATYANRFDSYGGERFAVDGAQAGPRDTVLVRSRLIKSNGESVQLNYLLLERPDAWKVIDVFAKGSISEIATKRSDYGAVMSREGFDTLISSINARVAEYSES